MKTNTYKNRSWIFLLLDLTAIKLLCQIAIKASKANFNFCAYFTAD